MTGANADAPPLHRGFDWSASADPSDETFGDLVVGTDLEAAGDFDAVLVGEPYDGAVIGRRGAREGPRAIRRELAGTKTHHFDAGPVRSVGDLGDLDLAEHNRPEGPGVAATQSAVREVAARVHGADALPVFLGGDNSLSFPNCAPLLAGEGSVGAINFDAHLDVREPVEGPSSGTPYRQLLAAGLDDLAVVGARHFETSTTYHDYLRERGGAVVTAEEVGDDPVAAADAALNALETDRVYVSVDCDVVDAAAAPGVSAPTPGGIAPRELFRALRLVAESDRVVGFEVVECAPGLEPGSADGDGGSGTGGFRTARVAARAIAHVLAARRSAARGRDREDGAGEESR